MNDGSIGSTFKGRTSRGTMALMHDYAELINEGLSLFGVGGSVRW